MIILLYVMDSLRYDFLSCYGYPKETSPNIDRLAREGVTFVHAFAQSTWTRPSAASMLSSTYPSVHGVFTVNDYPRPGIQMLPEPLRRAGFRTIAVSSLGNISPEFGFGRGFDHFIELYKDQALLEKRQRLRIGGGENDYEVHFRVNNEYIPIATSEDINRSLIPFVQDSGDGDLFSLAWSMDTHNPYFQRDPRTARFHPPSTEILWSKDIQAMRSPEEISRLKAYYEEMIYYNDYHVGLLVERLKELKLYEETFFILTGDHGEGFGERGYNSHSGPPFDEQIRVPLIMKFPHSEFRGKVDGLVQHIDLAPTILEYAGVRANGMHLQGKSLLPLLHGGTEPNDFVFVEYQVSKNFPSYVALRNNQHKYMETRRQRVTLGEWFKERGRFWPSPWFIYKPTYLFRLSDDPGEKVNMIHEDREIAETFRSHMKLIMEENDKLSRGFEKWKKKEKPIDKEIAKQLQALGYFNE
jgi:arylsulfatase A-like enzyme